MSSEYCRKDTPFAEIEGERGEENNLKYLITGIEHQLDNGFGINADAFNSAANFLYESKEYNEHFIPQKHMPVFYLYRHSIELYLKSMILLLHLELKIPYEENSDKPKILTQDGKWRDLDNCHWIDSLFWYWSKLIEENSDKLKVIAPKGGWVIPPNLNNLINKISEYDKDSTYFRYPVSKKSQNNKDKEKYSMKKINDIEEVHKNNNPTKGGISLFLIDANDNIEAIYSHKDNVLSDLLNDLKEASNTFDSYHIMVRMTLCDGF